MKTYSCPKCGSTDLFMENVKNHCGLYCGDCGQWIKWLGDDEKRLVSRFLNSVQGAKEAEE